MNGVHVVLHGCPVNRTLVAPLPPDRCLPPAPLAQLHVFSHLVVPSQLRGALTPLAVDPKFGMTCKVDVPGDACFRQARGPCNQNVAERGYLPRVDHCSIHVVLPSAPRIARHCLYILTPALGSTLATFFFALPVLLAWHCVILSVYFSSDTTAARSRDLVVCMLLSFLSCILTSRCGA